MSEREVHARQGDGVQAGQGEERPAASGREGGGSRGEGKDSGTPALEWVIAGLGLVLVIGAVGFMLYKAVWGETSPPEVLISAESVVQTQTGYLVKFRAYNQGGSTAEGVIIQGELRRGPESAESSQTTLEYLPSHSERKGGLFFKQDPRQFELQLKAFGYEEP